MLLAAASASTRPPRPGRRWRAPTSRPNPEPSGRPAGSCAAHSRGWDIDDDTADSAILCLSEVVTNAVVHTGRPSEVRVLHDDGVLTVSVRDQGIGYSAGPADTDPLRVHGRGLELVDALADRWGSDVDAVGMTVWFVFVPLAARPQPHRRIDSARTQPCRT